MCLLVSRGFICWARSFSICQVAFCRNSEFGLPDCACFAGVLLAVTGYVLGIGRAANRWIRAGDVDSYFLPANNQVLMRWQGFGLSRSYWSFIRLKE